MPRTCSFKFVDDALNNRLRVLLQKAGIRHTVEKNGSVRYCSADEDLVENDLLSSIRNEVFPSWQVLTCPRGWAARYKQYMTARDIPFKEEVANNKVWFLIPGNYRPHSWKLPERATG